MNTEHINKQDANQNKKGNKGQLHIKITFTFSVCNYNLIELLPKCNNPGNVTYLYDVISCHR